MNEVVKKAKQILASNIYMTIASASKEGEPWISPVFFAYDEYYNLYWTSNKGSKHSQLIRNNPRVAIVIFDSRAPEGEGDGIYFEATAEELNNEPEIRSAMELLSARVTKDEFRVKSVEEVSNDSAWRIYRAVPTKTYKLGDGEHINGQYVDRRIEINLKHLET